jgi:hypothetical protein
MDLSTTKKIKRRRFQIQGKEGELTRCFITGTNFFENRDLSNVKFRISSFRFNNTSIPTFLPKFLSSYPSTSYINDLAPGDTVTYNQPNLTPTLIDYIASIRHAATNTNHGIIFDFKKEYSRHVDNKPTSKYQNAFSQYTNSYFYVYDTSLFCELIATQISNLTTTLIGINNACNIAKLDDDSYVLYMRKEFFDAGYSLQFSEHLIELFAFKNMDSVNGSKIFDVKFNSQTTTYAGATVYSTFSQYISDKWFSYDALVFKTNLPVEKISVSDQDSYTARGYENILLIFKIDGIPYNFFSSAFTPDDNWCSLFNTNIGENFFLNLYLQLRETNDIVPYTIKVNEKFFVETEEIDTF